MTNLNATNGSAPATTETTVAPIEGAFNVQAFMDAMKEANKAHITQALTKYEPAVRFQGLVSQHVVERLNVGLSKAKTADEVQEAFFAEVKAAADALCAEKKLEGETSVYLHVKRSSAIIAGGVGLTAIAAGVAGAFAYGKKQGYEQGYQSGISAQVEAILKVNTGE